MAPIRGKSYKFRFSEKNAGYFELLPVEMLHKVFEYLNLSEIGQLGLSCDILKLKIVDWMNSAICLKRGADTLKPFFDPAYPARNLILRDLVKEFPKHNEFALLCKKLTCLSPTRSRIKFAFSHFDACLKQNEASLNQWLINVDWTRTMNILQFMKMLHTFMKGWDESEFVLVFRKIDSAFQIGSKLSVMMSTNNMQDVSLDIEMSTRLVLRAMIWDMVGDDFATRGSWVLTAMKYFVGDSAKAQAKFLLSLFGSPCEDNSHHYLNASALSSYQRAILDEMSNHFDWDSYTEQTPTSFHEGKKMFYTLAQVVCTCFSYSETWKENSVNDVLKSIFTTPFVWQRENIAGFLLFCSETLIMHFVQEMLFDDSDEETRKAASLVIDMIVMSLKFDNELSSKKGMGKVFDRICAPETIADDNDRSKFHQYLWLELENQLALLDMNGQEDDASELLWKVVTHLMANAFCTKYVSITEAQPTMDYEE